MITNDHDLRMTLAQLTELVASEREAVNSPQLEAYAVFYTAFMAWIKYEVKWYGVRSLSEYRDMNETVLAPLHVQTGVDGETVADDELPSYRWSLLTRLTQGLRARSSDPTWNAACEQVLDHVIDIYPEMGSMDSELYAYTEDCARYVDLDTVKSLLVANPHILTLALLSLLPHEALFIPTEKGGL